jgi:hypothetical protein
MVVPLNVTQSSGTQVIVIDSQELKLAGMCAPGQTTLSLASKSSVDPTQLWRIARLVVTSSSTNTLNLTVTDGTDVRDYGQLPPGFPQVAEYPQFMRLFGSQTFTLQVSNLNAGDTVTVVGEYDICAKVAIT